MSIFVEPALA